LSFNGTSGTISGTPTAIQATTPYTVTPVNQGGNGTPFQVQLEVLPRPPSNCSYPVNLITAVNQISFTSPIPNCSSGGAATGFTVLPTPALPAGVQFNSTNGTFYGTPTAPQAAQTYNITPTDAGGSGAQFFVQLQVIPGPPSNCSYPATPITATNQTYFTSSSPTCSGGGPPTGFTLAPMPSLPPGVQFDGTNGTFYGTPKAIETMATYTVTPLNQAGNGTSFPAQFEVLPQPPSGCTYPPIFKTVNQSGWSVTPTCTGGDAATSFAAATSTPLPQNLTVDPASGVISGTLTAYTQLAPYTIDVSNAGGGTSASVQIAAVTMTTLTPGHTVWGADGHIDKGGVYGISPSKDCSVPGLAPNPTCAHSQIGDLEAIYGANKNSIFYRFVDDITGCVDVYYGYLKNGTSPICDPTKYPYKAALDTLQATGVIMPITGLILYPFTSPVGCATGSFDTSLNVPNASFSEVDMYNWGYCMASRAIAYAPENIYWYVGNEWNGQIPYGPINQYPNNENLDYPIDPAKYKQWQWLPSYPYYRGALAGAIAAIRDKAPYATILSGVNGGDSSGLSVALAMDLKDYTMIDPKGRNLVWDVTSLHWGDSVESVALAKQNGFWFQDSGIGEGLPDYASLIQDLGENVYQALNSVGQNAFGVIPPIFVDEMGSGDGDVHTSSLEASTGTLTVAQMQNFLANSPATSTTPGLVGGNFYELYPTTSTDTSSFLYCYSSVCDYGTPGGLSYAGADVQTWVAQHGNPSTNSGAKFTLTPAHTSLTLTLPQTATNSITVTGSSLPEMVTLTCSIFGAGTAATPVDATTTPGCNFAGQPSATVAVGSSATVSIVPTSTTVAGSYTVFIQASYGGAAPAPTDAAADIHFPLQINP
jgi:hypothetical protein